MTENVVVPKPSAAVEILKSNIGKKTNITLMDMVNLFNTIIYDVSRQAKTTLPIRISNTMASYYSSVKAINGLDEFVNANTYQNFLDMFDEKSDKSLYSTHRYIIEDLQIPTYTIAFNTYFEELEPLVRMGLVTMMKRQNY